MLGRAHTRIARFLAGLLALVAFAAPTQAAFTSTASYAVAGGPVAASTAPGAIGNGWVDAAGSQWSIDATNVLKQASISASPWNAAPLLRQASENSIDGRIVTSFTLGGFVTYGVGEVSRASYSGGNLTAYGVIITNTIQFYKIVGGVATSLKNTTSGVLPSNTAYVLAFDTVTLNGTTTALTATLYAADGTTVILTTTVLDTTASLQGVSGALGVFNSQADATFANDPKISAIRVYTGDAAVSSTTLAVDSTAFLFSPGNWYGNAGRGGSTFRQSWVNGAWFTVAWTASASPNARLMLPSTTTGNVVSYYLNGVLVDGVAATGPITLQAVLPNAANTLTVFLRNSPQVTRWAVNAANTLQVLGLQIDAASSAGIAPAARKYGLVFGDSLTEGINYSGASASSLVAWTYALRTSLDAAGYDLGVDACGFSGWLRPGDSTGDVPALYSVASGTYSDSASRWNKIASGVSRLDANGRLSSYGATGTEPAFIAEMMGTNEALNAVSVTDTRASVTQFMTAARAASTPATQIYIVMPFGLRHPVKYSATYAAAIVSGFNDYQTANPSDLNVLLIDTTVARSTAFQQAPNISVDYIHPTIQGHLFGGAPAIEQIVTTLQPPTARRAFAPGFH